MLALKPHLSKDSLPDMVELPHTGQDFAPGRGMMARSRELGPPPGYEGSEPVSEATERARELRDAGVSFNVIAKTLTAEGYPTPKGGAWHGVACSGCCSPSPVPVADSMPHTEESKRKMSESHKRAFANGRQPTRYNAGKTHCPRATRTTRKTRSRSPGGAEPAESACESIPAGGAGGWGRPNGQRPAHPRAPGERRATNEPLVYYAVRDGLVKIGTTTHFRGRMQEQRAEKVLGG